MSEGQKKGFRSTHMSDFAIKPGGLQQVFGLFESLRLSKSSESTPNSFDSEESREFEGFFLSPATHVKFLLAVDTAREIVRDHWEEIPEDLRQRLRAWVWQVVNCQDQKPRLFWAQLGFKTSRAWASFRLHRNLQSESSEACQGLIYAILEQIVLEPPGEVKDLDSYLESCTGVEPEKEVTKIRRKGSKRVQAAS